MSARANRLVARRHVIILQQTQALRINRQSVAELPLYASVNAGLVYYEGS